MKARDIVLTGVERIPAHETLDRAAQRMRRLDVGVLPVCGENDRSKVTAGELAEGPPKWIAADADVREVLDALEQHQVKPTRAGDWVRGDPRPRGPRQAEPWL